MLRIVLGAAALLAATPAIAQDWIEIANYGGVPDKAGSFVFVDMSRIQLLEGDQYSAPFLEVTRKNYVERTITASCSIKLEFSASQWRDRRGTVAFDAKATSRKLTGHAAGALGASLGAEFAPPRKQDLLLGRWLCDAPRPVGGTQFIRRPGDPKPAAWARLDANHAKLPDEVNALLAQAAPSLTYIAPQQSAAVRSLRVERCELELATGSGAVRLPLRQLQHGRSGSLRLTFRNFETGATVALDGFPAEGIGAIDSGLTRLKSDC